MHSNFVQSTSFFIIVILVLICIPASFCRNGTDYATCGSPFQCSSIRDISYPFWGEGRPEYCGYPGFQLNCQGDVPILNILSNPYRVLEINYTTKSLKVARDDLWSNLCPTVLYNTTLDFNLFTFSINDQNITLYYSCVQKSPVYSQKRPKGSFMCENQPNSALSIFAIGETSDPETDITCDNNITVPVNKTAARDLATSTASVRLLQDALASGFSLQWLANNGMCQNCVQSGGLCGTNRNTSGSFAFACYCADRAYAQTCNYTQTGNGYATENATSNATVPAIAPFPWYYVETGGPSPVSDVFPADSGNTRYNTSMANERQSRKKYVIVGVLTSVGVTILSICLCWCCEGKHLSKSNNQHVETFLLNNESLSPKRYNYSEIKSITKSFSNELGKGGYGSVYKGMLPDGRLVAVKLLNEVNSNGEEFMNEVASISRTSHVNIVNLLGFCYDRNRRALVYEFMPNKSLDKFIYKSGSLKTDCQLEWKTLYQIAIGVAQGLEYLHGGCNTRIVHFDIKPHNILLDEDLCPKISDFGLSKLCRKKQSILSTLGARGTVGYIAPEVCFRNFGGVSYKSDVYSYGMMVLEMAGARKIDEVAATQSSENYFPDQIYELIVVRETVKFDEFLTDEVGETARKMFLVGFWCIQTAPSERPSMTKVLEMLKGSLESIPIPPKPLLFSPRLPAQNFSSSLSENLETE